LGQEIEGEEIEGEELRADARALAWEARLLPRALIALINLRNRLADIRNKACAKPGRQRRMDASNAAPITSGASAAIFDPK
jgi:hypothetical protein